jgi:hypothetical protein
MPPELNEWLEPLSVVILSPEVTGVDTACPLGAIYIQTCSNGSLADSDASANCERAPAVAGFCSCSCCATHTQVPQFCRDIRSRKVAERVGLCPCVEHER